MFQTRNWTFKVTCKVKPGEKVYVVGSCIELGNWNPQDLLPLEPKNPQDLYRIDCDILWQASIILPTDEIQYRYCIANTFKMEKENEDVLYYAVKSWETNIHPRLIPANENNDNEPLIEDFGFISNLKRVEEGWLDQEYLVEFKLFKSNIYGESVKLWKRKHKNRKCFVKMIPINLSKNASTDSVLEAPTDESTEAELAEFRLRSTCLWPSVNVSVLKEDMTEFVCQTQFGVCFSNQDFISLRCRVAEPQSIAYLMDFYVEMKDNETPQYIGCSYVLPSNLKENAGVANFPITSDKHLPIGQITVHYLVVQPLHDYKCNMEVSYARYWKETWKGIEVGHRGSGNSFHSQTKNCANIRENTIASLKYASENGADMVEFDVQLSKDFIPLIYHDFHVFLELKHKKDTNKNDIMQIPVKDLTLDQLQALKVYHKTEKGSSKFSDEDFEDHQPFPTLQKAMDVVPLSCGFNIEIKWTMRLHDGTYELDHPFELNRFIDKILSIVLENAGHRKIIFSSFHPDICTMIRMKQNRFPVLFLTEALGAKRPESYHDVRTRTMRNAVLYAASANILGINVQSEDLLRDSSEIQLAYDYNLVAFCWGDQNSDKESIELLKKLGLHGIIYDKIDVYTTKKNTSSIFLCEDKDTCKCIPSKRRASPSSQKRLSSKSPEYNYEPPSKIAKMIDDDCPVIKICGDEIPVDKISADHCPVIKINGIEQPQSPKNVESCIARNNNKGETKKLISFQGILSQEAAVS